MIFAKGYAGACYSSYDTSAFRFQAYESYPWQRIFCAGISVTSIMCTILWISKLYVSLNPPVLGLNFTGPEELLNSTIIRTSGNWELDGQPFFHLNFPFEISISKSAGWGELELDWVNVTFENSEFLGSANSRLNIKLIDDVTIMNMVANLRNDEQTAIACNAATSAYSLLVFANVYISHTFLAIRHISQFQFPFHICCSSDKTCGR